MKRLTDILHPIEEVMAALRWATADPAMSEASRYPVLLCAYPLRGAPSERPRGRDDLGAVPAADDEQLTGPGGPAAVPAMKNNVHPCAVCGKAAAYHLQMTDERTDSTVLVRWVCEEHVLGAAMK